MTIIIGDAAKSRPAKPAGRIGVVDRMGTIRVLTSRSIERFLTGISWRVPRASAGGLFDHRYFSF
ncbi:hypothetical protein [Mesorhizobium sp. M0220]|uniref:hypothetical protein n=1 Tax=Mesorhizobium sp. M0220 TaxID=2956920 RepID=UPI0033370628